MSTQLTQAIINKVHHNYKKGHQLYDAEAPGLRVVLGKNSASYKFTGRINDGSKRYVSLIIGRTNEVSLKTARDKASELRLSLRRGVDPRLPKSDMPSVEEAFNRYLGSREKELSPKTVNWYKQKLEGPLSSLKKAPVHKVGREQVRKLHESLSKNSGGYGANGAMRVLKLILNDAARSYDLPPNPVSRGVRMNKEHARDWSLGPDELPLFWERLDRMAVKYRRCCWMLMLLTGLRSSNARAVKWEHVEEGGILFVPRAKSGRSFRIPVPKIIIDELEKLKSEPIHSHSPYIYPSMTSQSGHIEQMKRIKNFPYAPHQMRHTYRTHALEAGIDFQTITILMDHANTHVSFNYVTRAHLMGHMKEAQEEVAKRMISYRELNHI